MPCSIHPQWPHGSEDCPLCLVMKPDTPPPSPPEPGSAPKAPADGETAEGLSAELLTLSGYFIVTPSTTLQGKPIDADYRLIFQRTYDALRKAAAALDASREAQARQAEQIANVSDAIAEYCSRNGDKGVPADSADAVRFIAAEITTLRAKLAEAERNTPLARLSAYNARVWRYVQYGAKGPVKF